MNVKELKEYLMTIKDESMMVIVSGYEGGYIEVDESDIHVKNILLDVHGNDDWYYGPHEDANYYHLSIEHTNKHKKVKALYI